MQINSQDGLTPSRAPFKRWALATLASGLLAVAPAFADDVADAQRLIKAEQYNEALGVIDKALAARPRDAQMRFLRGVILTEQGKSNDAIAHFLRMTEDFPELPEPYNNLAALYARQGELDKARAALQMAIRTNPAYATAHENLGDVHTRLAGQAYSRALQLDTGNASLPMKLKLIRELVDTMLPRGGARAPAVVPTAPSASPAVAPALPPAPVAQARPASAPATAPAPRASAPAPATATVPPTSAATADASKAAVEGAVRNWAQAWANKDMAAYLGAYGKDFDPERAQSRSAWESERRTRITSKRSISVGVSDLTINVTGDKARATFRQAYKADALEVTSRKTLDLVRSGDRWVIVREATGG